MERTGPSWKEKKKKEIKERGRKHGSNNERAVGVGMFFPPLLAAPVFNPQIHVEFRFALLLFGGRVMADNKLCL